MAQSTKRVPTRTVEAEPLTSVVRMMMAMTSQAIPSRAIGYFVTVSIRSTRSWRPPDGLAPAIVCRRRSSLRSFSSRRSRSSLSRRWMRSIEDGFLLAVPLPAVGPPVGGVPHNETKLVAPPRRPTATGHGRRDPAPVVPGPVRTGRCRRRGGRLSRSRRPRIRARGSESTRHPLRAVEDNSSDSMSSPSSLVLGAGPPGIRNVLNV